LRWSTRHGVAKFALLLYCQIVCGNAIAHLVTSKANPRIRTLLDGSRRSLRR
jgi:hypothetical protein